MSVTTTHPDYDYYADQWKRVDDTLAGLDAVVHLAWQIQPSHDQRVLHQGQVAPRPGEAAVTEFTLVSAGGERTVAVAGPRIDPGRLPASDGLDVHGYVEPDHPFKIIPEKY